MKTALFTRLATYRLTCTLLCTLAITTLGCSQEEPNALEGTRKRVTVTATIPESGPETRMIYPNGTGQLRWEDGDAFRVWKKGENSLNIFSKINGTAEFEGEIFCKEGDRLYAIYPPVKDNIYVDADGDMCPIQLMNQSGGYDGLDKRAHYMYAVGKLEDDRVHFAFKHVVAMVRISWKSIKLTSFTLKAPDLSNLGFLYMTESGGRLNGPQRGDINVSGNLNFGNAFIFLIPGTVSDITVEATDGTNNYVGTLPGRTLTAGTIYEAEVAFTKVP